MKKEKSKKEVKPKAAAADVILEAMVDGIGVIDVNGNHVQVNKALLKMYGCKSTKELIGKPVSDFIKKEDIPKTFSAIKECLKKGVFRNLELIGLTKQGKEFPMMLNATVLKDSKGEFVGLLGVMRDITELKKLQESKSAAAAAAAQTAGLKEVEAGKKKLENMIETSTDVICVEDLKGTLKMVNSACEKVTGYKKKEMIGKKVIRKLVSKKDAQKSLIFFKNVIEKGSDTAELKLVAKSGKEVPILLSGTLLRDVKGKPNEIFLIVKDITELKKSQEQIAEAWQYSENLIGNIPSAILVFDDKLNCKSANWTYYNTFQKKPKHIIGNHVSHAVPSGLITDYYLDKKIIEVMKTGKTAELLKCVYHNEHEKIFDIKIIKIVKGKAAAAAAAFVMVVIDDITEKAKAEEQIKESEEKYKLIFESSREGMATADLKGVLIDANKAFCDMHGYKREELVNKKTFIELTPKKWNKIEEDIIKNQVMVKGYSNSFDKEQIKKNGESFPVNVIIHLIKDEKGKPFHLWAIVRDITEMKKAQEALEKAKKELEDKVADLEKFSKVAVGRELKMVELKKEIRRLERKLGGE